MPPTGRTSIARLMDRIMSDPALRARCRRRPDGYPGHPGRGFDGMPRPALERLERRELRAAAGE